MKKCCMLFLQVNDSSGRMRLQYNWSFMHILQKRLEDELQRTNTENCKQIFPKKELRGHSPNFHIFASVSDLFFSTIDLPILLQENM